MFPKVALFLLCYWYFGTIRIVNGIITESELSFGIRNRIIKFLRIPIHSWLAWSHCYIIRISTHKATFKKKEIFLMISFKWNPSWLIMFAFCTNHSLTSKTWIRVCVSLVFHFLTYLKNNPIPSTKMHLVWQFVLFFNFTG